MTTGRSDRNWLWTAVSSAVAGLGCGIVIGALAMASVLLATGVLR